MGQSKFADQIEILKSASAGPCEGIYGFYHRLLQRQQLVGRLDYDPGNPDFA